MPFSMQCNNKGCGQIQSPYLDKETNQVFCSLCEKEILNATSFAKNQMKSMKQFKEKKQKSFSVKCNNCGVLDRPILESNSCKCASCKKEMNVSPIFINVLQENLKLNKD